MGAVVGALKNTRYQYVFQREGYAANRAVSLLSPVHTIGAAADVHQAVFAPGYRGEGQRLYQIALFQFRGAYRASLKIAGRLLFRLRETNLKQLRH